MKLHESLEDIRTIVDKQSELDSERIEYWVKSFGEIFEIPELWHPIEDILKG